jgi:hypothetical protein
MISSKKTMFFWISWVALLLFSSLSYFVLAASDQWIVTLQIVWLGIRHGTPNNVNLWTPVTSSSTQEIVWQFDDNFRVEDLQGYITGHYTTIQCDGIYGPGGYKLTGVLLKAGNTTPTLLLWSTGNVRISTGLYNYTSIINPMTYIYKSSDIINKWLTNRYGDMPRLKIIIPAFSPPGSYSGTIVFSMYMY